MQNTPIVVMCDSKYATMETAVGRDYGIRSRGLQAAYYLKKVGGYTNVRFLTGGFLGWKAAGLPVKQFSSADANPFGERNMSKMSQILFFLIFVTSFKTGAIFLPFIFLSEPGTLCDSYNLCELEEIRSIYVNTFKNMM
ncbi:hypothetical protein CYMTET_16897 [Cymbomonas tetramitiformis]|uniref:Rhodanese domain-containing protein n=1 Tax=Cymbomonas tetramitiformis TaxID=36881 RepID=A0AAE0GBB1_9CHLO|nr:hypothetical protein CYMTET_16897 [Cymbomonas tetramitiformis]